MNRSLFFHIPVNNLPFATAIMQGNANHTNLSGVVEFYPVPFGGILIVAELSGLPVFSENVPSFLGFHIHETGDCSDDFMNAGNHFKPDRKLHPHHAGDLPPLLNNNGYAYSVVYDSYLTLSDILGRSVIIHSNRDDFTTQPAGDSGTKIACGIITPVRRM